MTQAITFADLQVGMTVVTPFYGGRVLGTPGSLMSISRIERWSGGFVMAGDGLWDDLWRPCRSR